MALVTRYFAATGSGLQDGTSWANRAPLINAGAWSTILTSTHDFTADGCLAMVATGTYAPTVALDATLFTNAPTAANPLIFMTCSAATGAELWHPQSWISPMPAWSDTLMAVIATTGNIATINLPNTICHYIKFTASGRTGGPVIQSGTLSWCVVINSGSGASASAILVTYASNCVLRCTGDSYSAISSMTAVYALSNCRLEGNGAGVSGNRYGIACTNNSNPAIERCTVVNCGGSAVVYTASQAGQMMRMRRCTVANNFGDGFTGTSVASPTSFFQAEGCMITGNTPYNVDSQALNFFVAGTRLRDAGTNNFNGTAAGDLVDYPVDIDNYVTDSDDATEYVNAAGGDYRIKNTASNVWGKGFGAGDEPAAAAGGAGSLFYPRVINGRLIQ